jgi:hypothetical protein
METVCRSPAGTALEEIARKSGEEDGLLTAYHQGRAGKTPCSAIMNVTVRYGDMLLWGCEPPANDAVCNAMAVRLLAVSD